MLPHVVSRHTQGIAVDDFPALMSLYAGASPPSANKRASSGTVRGSGGGGGCCGGRDDVAGDMAGLAAARARVNRSLVMRVEKIAATAQLWSLVPWSGVRRYDRVHVKGITLRLKQVKGILNFSFVALNKKGRGCAGAGGAVGADTAGAAPLATGVGDAGAGSNSSSSSSFGSGCPNDGGRRNPSFGGGLGCVAGSGGSAGTAAPGQSSGGSMEDLDGIDTDGEYTTDTDDIFDDDEKDSCYDELLESELLAGVDAAAAAAAADRNGDVGDAPRLVRQRSRSSSTVAVAAAAASEDSALRSQSVTTAVGGALRGEARNKLAPWSASRAGSGGGGGGPHTPGDRARSVSLSVRPKRSTRRPSSPPSENLGNLGVFKVLGEAFMRRFNCYSDQVRES